jgi:uncharacterized Zn finger protein (UPF0148 family)
MVMATVKVDVVCPCCESKLVVDAKTGEVLWKEEKPKPEVSLSDLVKGLDAQKKEQENLFKKNTATQKERDRLLDEKFKEAQKNVDKTVERPIRDFDFD